MLDSSIYPLSSVSGTSNSLTFWPLFEVLNSLFQYGGKSNFSLFLDHMRIEVYVASFRSLVGKTSTPGIVLFEFTDRFVVPDLLFHSVKSLVHSTLFVIGP